MRLGKKTMIMLIIVAIILVSVSIYGKGYISVANLITFGVDGFLLGYWVNER